MKKVIISGGFDPIHVGHIKLIQEAKKLGDYLIVIVNNDNWLKTKKGYCFMNQNDRKVIIESIKGVDEIIVTNHITNDTDTTVCDELFDIVVMSDDDGVTNDIIFANGGDRKSDNIPEYTFCTKNGIKMVFNVGGEKIESSSELVKKAKECDNDEKKET